MTNKKLKTLLVIGNGFDLAHGLKTKYTDFLDFVKTVKNSLIERQNRRINKLTENHLRSLNLKQYTPYQRPRVIESEKKEISDSISK